MTNNETIDKLINIKSYLTAGNPIWDVGTIREVMDMAIEALKQNPWIPCSERLPIKDDCVFVYLFGDSPYIAWHDGVDWCTEDFPVDKDEEPIAWMPLPKAYEGREE